MSKFRAKKESLCEIQHTLQKLHKKHLNKTNALDYIKWHAPELDFMRPLFFYLVHQHLLRQTQQETHLTFTCSKSTIEKIKKRCEICSKLTIKTAERCHWYCSGVSIVKFEHISHLFLMFLLLTLNKLMLAGEIVESYEIRLTLLIDKAEPR